MEVKAIGDGLKRILMDGMLKLLSVDVVRNILEKLVRELRTRAEATATPVDDWAIDFLESVIADDGKLKVLTDYIKGKINAVHVCEASPREQDEYVELAATLTREEDGGCCASVSMSLLAELLRVILPVLVDWFANISNEEPV